MKRKWQDPEFLEMMERIYDDPTYKKEMSIKNKKQWQDPEYVKMIRRHICPNKAELKLGTYLSKDWEFTGDWKHIVGGKLPDFTNYKTKQLIEMYGDYHHQGQDPQERIDFFKKHGWDCLVVWERELKDPDTLRPKLKGYFVNGKRTEERLDHIIR